MLKSGIDNDHIIEIALDGIENEELRDPKKCYQYIKDAMKDNQNYYLLLDEVCRCVDARKEIIIRYKKHSTGWGNSSSAFSFFEIFIARRLI